MSDDVRTHETSSSTANDASAIAGSRVVVYGMNYAPEFAGVGRYTGDIVDHLVETGADVTVVTAPPHYPGWTVRADFRNWFSRSDRPGLRVLRCPLLVRRRMGGVWRLVAPFTFALTSAPVVIAEILRRRPSVVFLVEPTLLAAPAALMAARLVGARTVLHVQDLEVDAAFAIGHLADLRLLKRLGELFERLCYAEMDQIVTIAESMAARLVEKGVPADRVAVVRNWVDLAHIHPLQGKNPYRAELGLSESDFVVLYSGNVGAKQGLPVLLDAADRLRDRPGIRFIVAGDGPARQDLIARYGHLGNVLFLPFQPYERLNDFLNVADLHALVQDAGAADLVLPSKLGGMLASGRRIVVTAGAETELAGFLDGAATVVAPGDVAALAAAIDAAAAVPDCPVRRATAGEKAERLAKTGALAALVALMRGGAAGGGHD